MSELLTYSRIQSFKTCRKKHWYEYQIGLRTIVDARALRLGTAHHAGIDAWKKTGSSESAIEAARASYGECPPQFDAADWEMERETVAALVSGYCWRWKESGHKIIASELPFRIPITNPATGAKSTLWELAGKIDGIIELEDGRLAVEEEKTVSEDIVIGSDYYRRLQIDSQPTIYIHAARQLGYDVSTVLWSCTRKPTIGPLTVSILDEDGKKIVLDATGFRVRNASKKAKKHCNSCGGSGEVMTGVEGFGLQESRPCECTLGDYRQTASTADGYVLQTRPMTPDEWTARLVADIGERPDFYYARCEIPRLDSEIDEFLRELWDIQKTIREAQNLGRWFRTVSIDTCQWCSYFGLCASKWTPEAGTPEGFQIVENKHPELSDSLIQPSAPAGAEQSPASPCNALAGAF